MGGRQPHASEITGLRFGKLEVISKAGETKRNHTLWMCQCDCGATTTSELCDLRSGKKQSCGCSRAESAIDRCTTHGATRPNAPAQLKSAYSIWGSMRKRCLTASSREFKWYGGRGISIAPEWCEFSRFIEDMGLPASGVTLERVDVNGMYSRENCTWVPLSRQASNKTTTLWVVYSGVKWCLKDLCRYLGVSYMKVYKRYVIRGWEIERALAP